MKYIVTIKPTKTFEIVSNDNDLGIFKVTSRWQGMIEMTRIDDGSTIVIQPQETTMTSMDRYFLNDDIPQDMRVVKVDLALWDQIKAATK